MSGAVARKGRRTSAGGWRRLLWLAASALVIATGLNLLTLTSVPLLVLALAISGIGTGLFAWTLMFFADKDGLLHRKRPEITLAIVATLFFLALTVGIAAVVRMPATARFVGTTDRYDPDLGWAGNTDATTIGQRRIRIDPDKSHLLFIGDSVLYGFGLSDEEVFATQLNRRYQNYQALNASVSGYSIDQYYISMQREVPRVRPQVTVVGIYAGNDFQITARDYGWGHSKPLFVLEGDRLVRVTGDLTRDNCIDRLAQSALFSILWSHRDFAERMLHTFCRTRELPEIEAARVDRRIFQEMAAIARQNDSKLLFLLLPDINDFPNVGDDEYLLYRSRYRDIRNLIVEGGYDLMENIMPLAQTREDPRRLYVDSPHLNSRGHQVMAAALFEELKRRYDIGE